MPIDALSVSCAQLTRDLLAIAKLLFISVNKLLPGILESRVLVLITGRL